MSELSTELLVSAIVNRAQKVSEWIDLPTDASTGEPVLIIVDYDYWRNKAPRVLAELDRRYAVASGDDYIIDHKANKAWPIDSVGHSQARYDDHGEAITPDSDIQDWIDYAIDRPEYNTVPEGALNTSDLFKLGFSEYEAELSYHRGDAMKSALSGIRTNFGDDVETLVVSGGMYGRESFFYRIAEPDVGIVLDGDVRGHYIIADVIDYAANLGFDTHQWYSSIGRDIDGAVLAQMYRDASHELTDNEVSILNGIADEATDWLNAEVARDESHFAWNSGSLFYGVDFEESA